jgi:adenylate cyclase
MASHCVPGRVQVSATTRAMLDDRFDFETRGSIEVKGKEMMETFFLNVRGTDGRRHAAAEVIE